MTKDYRKQILNILVDWYEESPAHARGETPARRRMMRLYDNGRTDYKAYVIDDHTIRKDINHAIMELAASGIVSFEWMRGQRNHIVFKVWLNFDKIDLAYSVLGRRPKGEKADELLGQIIELVRSLREKGNGAQKHIECSLLEDGKGLQKDCRSTLHEDMQGGAGAEWAIRWLEDIAAGIIRKRSAPAAGLPAEKSEREDLFKVVCWLALEDIGGAAVDRPASSGAAAGGASSGDVSAEGPATDSAAAETLERVFSLRCLGGSKRFEQVVRARLAGILKKYLIQEECTDEEALRAVGLVRSPELFEFSGPLSIRLPEGETDFSPLVFGGTLTVRDLEHGEIKVDPATKSILSIENKANYVDYILKSKSKDELVLFLGGHFSPARRVFLKAVATAMPDGCVFSHWGDIDFGGFSILARLRREILPGVSAERMGIDELVQYSQFAKCFPAEYRKRLATLLDVPELADCSPCIEYMLDKGVRLEQEAMLI